MYGVCIFGSPGSGKTTLCYALADLLTAMEYECILINLDPSSLDDGDFDISIKELITVNEIQELEGLGPNGAILYSMEFLERNIRWLSEKLAARKSMSVEARLFLLFDFPGQVECYIAYDVIDNIITDLLVEQNHALCGLLLTEARHLVDPHLAIGTGMSIAAQQVALGLPVLSVATKYDLLNTDGRNLLAVGLEEGFVDTLTSHDNNSHVSRFELVLAEFLDSNLALFPLPISVKDPDTLQLLFQEVSRILGM